jgi:hypothetical protein
VLAIDSWQNAGFSVQLEAGMTLREALDMLELNERTLEQSMLDVALHNRLEHTELRHVMRVFEAYRKVNAFLNPSLNTQGDARVTIIDESVPGMETMEFSKAAAPDHWGSSDTSIASSHSAAQQQANLNPRDSFSDHLIETSVVETSIVEPSDRDFVVYPTEVRLPTVAERRAGTGISAIALMGLGALAFGAGVLVIGPLLGRLMPPRAPTVTTAPVAAAPVPPTINPVTPPASSAAVQPRTPTTPPAPINVAPTPAAPPVQTVPPRQTVTPPASNSPAPVAPPRASSPAPQTVPSVPDSPRVTEAPTANPPAPKPSVAATTPRASSPTTPKPAQPRVTTPRAAPPQAANPRAVTSSSAPIRTTQPRVPPARVATSNRPVTPQVQRPTRVGTPRVAPVVAQRVLNERQFVRWDRRGAVLRYRSWNLVPSAVRNLSTAKFRAAVFVATSPAAMPDLPR